MTIPILRIKAFQELDLFIGELDQVPLVLLLEPEQPLVAGLQVVS
jgi:hypothetical protein